MNELVNRLSLGAAQAKTLNRQPTAQMLLDAVEAIETRDARIAELTEALQDVLALSDYRKSRELAEIKEVIAKARAVLASSGPKAVRRTASEDDVANALYSEYRSILRS
ncbi:MAG TPA: hypothetical protein VEM36_15030 [Xanthobacteraceae bacterium]|nr:hypothetical protein [Xanthobacteraceae bacterium]